MNSYPCRFCNSIYHFPFQCAKNPKKKKPLKKIGKRTLIYEDWKRSTAIPYLDATYGHICSDCGKGGELDVDHIKNRSTHPHLKMDLDNVMYRCRMCHIAKTRGNGV